MHKKNSIKLKRTVFNQRSTRSRRIILKQIIVGVTTSFICRVLQGCRSRTRTTGVTAVRRRRYSTCRAPPPRACRRSDTPTHPPPAASSGQTSPTPPRDTGQSCSLNYSSFSRIRSFNSSINLLQLT